MSYFKLTLLVPCIALISLYTRIELASPASSYPIASSNITDPSSVENLLSEPDPVSEPDPETAHDYFRQGYYERIGSNDEAIESFTKAIEIDPKSGQSYLERADRYLYKITKTKDISEWRNLQQKVIMDLSKAIAYLRDHNYYPNPSEERLNEIIADAYLQKGLTLWNLGINSSALEDLKKALALYDKSYSSSYDERILIFIEKIEKGEKPSGKYGCNAFYNCSNLIDWK